MEEWIKAQAVDTDEMHDHTEQINSRLIDIEAIVEDYPISTTAKIEPTFWDSIVSILNKPEPEDPFASSTWTKTTKNFHILQSDVLQHKQQYEDFKDALIRLCGQFKSDIEHLGRQIKVTNSQISNQVNPGVASNLFGSIQSQLIPEVEVLNKNYEDVLGKLEQLNESVKAFASSPSDGTPDGVEIGDLKFLDRPDLGVWVKDNLEKWNFPFGVFLDVYTVC